jgi:RNA polymerase sigma factor (TIGR02999 family)
MEDERADELRSLIEAVNAGDPAASSRMFEALYGELRSLARSRLCAHGPGATLDPTALVHEAWLRIDGSPPASLNDSRHFVALVGRAMRRVMIDGARRRAAAKRGSDPLMTTLPPDQPDGASASLTADELIALDAALEALQARDAEMARVVELKYFAGLTFAEVAKALDLSERSVHRRWTAARAWLLARLD